MLAFTPSVHVAETFFKALNKIQTEWLLLEKPREIGEVKTFQSMLMSGLVATRREMFLRSRGLADRVRFERNRSRDQRTDSRHSSFSAINT